MRGRIEVLEHTSSILWILNLDDLGRRSLTSTFNPDSIAVSLFGNMIWEKYIWSSNSIRCQGQNCYFNAGTRAFLCLKDRLQDTFFFGLVLCPALCAFLRVERLPCLCLFCKILQSNSSSNCVWNVCESPSQEPDKDIAQITCTGYLSRRSKTSPQAKRHQPSLHITPITSLFQLL